MNTGLTRKNIRSQETRRGTVKKKKYIQAEVKESSGEGKDNVIRLRNRENNREKGHRID